MNRKIFLVIITLFSMLYSDQVSDWITIEGCAPVSNITNKKAIKNAIRDAERKAIEKYCGLQIQSQSFVKDYTMQADFISSITYGYVVEAETLKITREDYRKNEREGFLDLVKVKMKLKVKKSKREIDPYFKLSAQLNKYVFNDGENAELKIQASKTSYLTIFSITENNEVYQLYPTKFLNTKKIKKNEIWEFPSKLTLVCPKNRKRTTEFLKVIATKEPLPFFLEDDNNTYDVIQGMKVWRSAESGLKDLAKILVNIPSDTRTELNIMYEIVK